MNNTALDRHPSVSSNFGSLRKSLVSLAVGLAISLAFYWGVALKTTDSSQTAFIPHPWGHAVYQWKGYCRVALNNTPMAEDNL